MNEARLAIERAHAKILNRFGTTREVLGELETALRLLTKETGSVSESAASSGTPPTPPIEEEAVEEEAAIEEKAEPRPRARKSMGRKK